MGDLDGASFVPDNLTVRFELLTAFAAVRREHMCTHPVDSDPAFWRCDCGAEGGIDVRLGQSGFWKHMDEVRLSLLGIT